MRISRHQAFMEIAGVFAKRSTCFRGNVGAIIVSDRNIVSAGYNGPPSGEPHCTGKHCADHTLGCHRSIHAERNAIQRLPLDIPRGRLSIYITDSPCVDCTDLMLGFGIADIYFDRLYRVNEHLKRAYVNVYRVTPSGYLIDFKTGELIE
jgi:dCMP deaminase